MEALPLSLAQRLGAGFRSDQPRWAAAVAPILEDLVFPRQRPLMGQWLRRIAELPVQQLVPAHFDAPIACTPIS